MALDSFSALLFVPPAPEVLAEIKISIGQCLLRFSDYSFHTMPFKISFMTWLSHYIVFQIRKGNKLTS